MPKGNPVASLNFVLSTHTIERAQKKLGRNDSWKTKGWRARMICGLDNFFVFYGLAISYIMCLIGKNY
jgi:hypothetical protein